MIYEVNISIQRSISDRFAAWLPDHVRQVLAAPGFVEAKIFRAEGQAQSPVHGAAQPLAEMEAGQENWVIHYEVESNQALENYLRERAPALRAVTFEEFGKALVATRRVLEQAQLIPAT